MNSVFVLEQVSLIHALSLPDHSVSKHLTPRNRRFSTLPLSSTAFRFRSRLHLWLAGSSNAPGRIEFVILRTGRSPPAALHHASLRRSCIRLQVGERFPGEDFHLSDSSRFQAHLSPASQAQWVCWLNPRLCFAIAWGYHSLRQLRRLVGCFYSTCLQQHTAKTLLIVCFTET